MWIASECKLSYQQIGFTPQKRIFFFVLFVAEFLENILVKLISWLIMANRHARRRNKNQFDHNERRDLTPRMLHSRWSFTIFDQSEETRWGKKKPNWIVKTKRFVRRRLKRQSFQWRLWARMTDSNFTEIVLLVINWIQWKKRKKKDIRKNSWSLIPLIFPRARIVKVKM